MLYFLFALDLLKRIRRYYYVFPVCLLFPMFPSLLTDSPPPHFSRTSPEFFRIAEVCFVQSYVPKVCQSALKKNAVQRLKLLR